MTKVVSSYDFDFNEEQKKIFIEQVREISLVKAWDVLGVLDIAEHNNLLSEVQQLLLQKLTSPVERIDEWYLSIYGINRSLCHLRMHAFGGAVNVSYWVTPKEDVQGEGESLIDGYYNFREGHLSKEEAEKFLAFVSEWTGPEGEKEELFNKLFQIS